MYSESVGNVLFFFISINHAEGSHTKSSKANICRVATANYKTLSFTVPDRLQIHLLSSVSRRHVSRWLAVDEVAGAARIQEQEFILKPSTAKRKSKIVSFVLSNICSRGFHLRWNHCTAGGAAYNICAI